jgi:hypothetical protein
VPPLGPVYTFLPLYEPVTLSFTFFSADLEAAVSFKSSFSSAAVFLTLVFVAFTSLTSLSLKRLSGVPSFLILEAVSFVLSAAFVAAFSVLSAVLLAASLVLAAPF